MQRTSQSPTFDFVAEFFLSNMRDIWELGLELTLLVAADIEITEAHLEHWRMEERDLEIEKLKQNIEFCFVKFVYQVVLSSNAIRNK